MKSLNCHITNIILIINFGDTMKDSEDIKVNRRKGDKVVFESPFAQSVYDKIGFLKDEATQILKDIDSKDIRQNIEDFDIEEFGENTVDHFEIIVDDLSKFKSEIVDSDDFPDFVKDYSHDAKKALNVDGDYIRRARRRLDRQESNEFLDVYKSNIRVVELCDKAIKLNDENPEAYYLKGLGLINLERYDDAIDEFIKSLALKDDVRVWVGIGDANRLNEDYGDAISVYNKALSLDEDSFGAHKGKGYTYYAREEYKQAYNSFRKANEIEVLDEKSQKLMDECFERI